MEQEEENRMSADVLFVAIAVLGMFAQFLDARATLAGIAAGGREWNPVARLVLRAGSSAWVAFKVPFLAVALPSITIALEGIGAGCLVSAAAAVAGAAGYISWRRRGVKAGVFGL